MAEKERPKWQRTLAKQVLESLRAPDPKSLEKLQRSVDENPSLLTKLGLSAVQVLSSMSEAVDVAGRSSRLSIVFTDLEGFSTFTEQEGDEAATGLLTLHHHEVEPLIRARGGNIVKHLGDGLLLTFPHPEAAVMAGLDLVRAQPDPLRLRAGIHTGDVMTTADDIIGHVVNVAARVTESASGGEVLATTVVRDAVSRLPGIAFGPAATSQFHGLSEQVGVCRVTAAAE